MIDNGVRHRRMIREHGCCLVLAHQPLYGRVFILNLDATAQPGRGNLHPSLRLWHVPGQINSWPHHGTYTPHRLPLRRRVSRTQRTARPCERRWTVWRHN